MATPTPSTEPLRAATPPQPSSTPQPEQPQPIRPDAMLQVPGQQLDGAGDDRNARSNIQTGSQATSRAPSPRPPSALFPHTQVTYEDPDFTRPPPLNYSLRTRKKAIFWFWTLIILDCVCMPIGLYFGMWYGTTREQLSANAVFSISTALLGTVSIVEYFIRFHRLWKKNSGCRVIGAQRWYLDWFHWNLSVGWFFVMIELIV